jgi:phosphonate transport system substrate-binding protein
VPTARRSFLALALAVIPALVVRAEGAPVRVGISPIITNDGYAALAGWRRYLERRLGRPVQFVQRSSYREMTSLLESGALEFAWICSNPYLQHEEQLMPVAVARHEGHPLYRAYIIVPAEAGELRSVEDLKGKVFAFSDPDSNSGHLVVRHLLMGRGTRPEEFFGKTFFAYGHPHVVRAVAEGLAHGGAVESYVWEVLARRDPALTSKTRVVWRSDWFGFPPIVASHATPAGLRETFSRALFAMAEDPEGLGVLASLELDGFGPVPVDLYDSVRRLRRELVADAAQVTKGSADR